MAVTWVFSRFCPAAWFVVAAVSGAVMAAEPAVAPPAHLRCEYRENPLGLDVAAPRLSWQLQDGRRGASQTAYQILVSTDGTFGDGRALVWDSGEVKSDQSIHVVYAGSRLISRQRCYWKVRVWDAKGIATDYSQPAWWETGLLEPTDWQARWITSGPSDEQKTDPVFAGSKWIWNAKAQGNQKHAWFRKTLHLDPAETVARASVVVTADNAFVMHINGVECASGKDTGNPQQLEVAPRLKTGDNLIALRGWNDDGPAGLLMSMRVKLGSGKIIDVQTGADWKTSAIESPDWMQPGADESTWEPAGVVGNYGDAPWGTLKTRPSARRSTCFRRIFTLRSAPARAPADVTGVGAYKR